MDLKISYLIAAVRRDKQVTDPHYLNILLNNDKQVPSKTIKAFIGETDEVDILKEIHSEYLNYHFEYVHKMLCGFRKLDAKNIEVCYITTVNYLPDINKNGEIYSLDDIQNENILLEEYYAELFFKFGPSTFR